MYRSGASATVVLLLEITAGLLIGQHVSSFIAQALADLFGKRNVCADTGDGSPFALKTHLDTPAEIWLTLRVQNSDVTFAEVYVINLGHSEGEDPLCAIGV